MSCRACQKCEDPDTVFSCRGGMTGPDVLAVIYWSILGNNFIFTFAWKRLTTEIHLYIFIVCYFCLVSLYLVLEELCGTPLRLLYVA